MRLKNPTGVLAAAFGAQAVLSESVIHNGSALLRPLDLGSIKPLGWFKDQLQLEAEGLSGNMFDFYRFVHDAKWIGGSTEYSALDEASPYWFNGLVPLAFGLGDVRILGQVKYYLDYVLDHQQDDGWLGFETTRTTRGLWARCLLLLGFVQYAEADTTQTERIVDSMHRYVVLAHSMLKNNFTGLLVHGNDTFDTAGFGVGRTHEMHIPLQWLLERYPKNNTGILRETMALMIDGGVVWGADWRTFWTEEAYPKIYLENSTYDLSWVFLHGVNMAEGLRYPLSIYRMTGDEALKTQTRVALNLLAKHHRSTAGSIIADEYIADLNPSRGSELCIAAEMMFSTAYIYQFLGDNDIADWAELVAFNAFPAAVAPDWWSHQYVQQENQPWSRNLSTAENWWDVGSYGNVFGLEPDYPCCTVNHPQAYPKFLANSFVTTKDGGMAHVFLIPGTAATKLGKLGDNSVFVTANTNYPFSNSIEYFISAASAFTFYIRIPNWADKNSTVNSKPAAPDSNGLHKIDIPAGESSASVKLYTAPRVVERANNTVAIYYGALLYALAIKHAAVSTAPVNYRSGTVLPANTTDHAGRTKDHILTPKTAWNIAIDPRQIFTLHTAPAKNSSKIASPIWDLGAPPVELRVAAVEIDWPVIRDTAADPGTFEVKAIGRPFSARFVPYGSSKLHMAVLPVLDLENVDLR
ncbi:duf1680 domain-containing protein [Clohesyomyces aquaticus]|uniref:Duf1680 domain-containing protein n=1 Tax=Clohesyomyces aquaticus TaxID=1231657 RepID=A0A1Y2A0B9_9PLEO|nr:duf1680 domain-containing protein [Clohesyomyces aquaticus]